MSIFVLTCAGVVIMISIVVFAAFLVKGASELEREIEVEKETGQDRDETQGM